MLLKTLIKRTIAALLGTALLWTAPALAAGTLPLAMAQQVDINGAPLAGCQVYFFVAGTPASPQNSFQDFGLTVANPQILTCDQAGRVPMFWLADGLVHVRMTDASGLQVIDTTMQVLGPSSGGGGGGGTVDPTSVISTGDLKVKYGTGPLTGFVRANGLTVGNATSGATERANADTQALFIYLYGVDANLVVSGGRTGNALNDFNANKTITMPDWRGRAIAALDDMGNSAAGRLTATYFGTAATVLGAAGGTQSQTLAQANLPTVTLTTNIIDPGHGHPGSTGVTQGTAAPSGSSAQALQGSNNTGTVNTQGLNIANNATGITASTPLGGTNTPHSIVQPLMLATIYIKL